MQNFSSLSGIVGMFSVSSLSPLLKKVLATLPKKFGEAVKDFESLINPRGNFKEFRKRIDHANKETALPCL